MFPVISIKAWSPVFFADQQHNNNNSSFASTSASTSTNEPSSFWVNFEVPVSISNRPNVIIRRLVGSNYVNHFSQLLSASTKAGGATIQLPPGNYTVEIK
jgi:hypothetical protein